MLCIVNSNPPFVTWFDARKKKLPPIESLKSKMVSWIKSSIKYVRKDTGYKREDIQVGKGVGGNWTKNEIAIYFIFSRLFDINDSRNDRNCHFNCQKMKNYSRKQSTT